MRIAVIACGLVLLAGCQREQRNPRPEPAEASVLGTVAREGGFIPGGQTPEAQITNPYNGNAQAISEGQRLFQWYNCAGCHSANAGGGMGPPLLDVTSFTYGGEPANIFDTIVKGRPNGMPSWGSRIPQYQIWQIVTYIRSLSGQQPKSATPARLDAIEPEPSTIQNKVRGQTQ